VEDLLRERLTRIGVDPDTYTDPFEVWCRLRAALGVRVGLIELYSIAGHPRGLAGHELSQAERESLNSVALPVIYPGYQVLPSSGRSQRDPVEIASYDSDWPRRFETWRDRLTQALGATAQRIEHVGSTAVPGLSAKPVIDIQVSVEHLEDEDSYVPQIETLGVQLRSRDSGHRFFRPFSGLPRDVQVHVCSVGSEWEQQHLLFRDYLRANARARKTYLQAKQLAADRWRDDRIAYAESKDACILDLMALAEKWANRMNG
jgi:GrpB-like predicted nucleotidyltransferase (UPF0157 family)